MTLRIVLSWIGMIGWMIVASVIASAGFVCAVVLAPFIAGFEHGLAAHEDFVERVCRAKLELKSRHRAAAEDDSK